MLKVKLDNTSGFDSTLYGLSQFLIPEEKHTWGIRKFLKISIFTQA